MDPLSLGVIVLLALILIAICSAVIIGGQGDDDKRWDNLMSEADSRFNGATYKAKIEFMRRDRYAKIREASNNHEDITELSEDYVMLMDEEERIEEGERQLGAEFDPYAAHRTINS